jgi:hypothetical protein
MGGKIIKQVGAPGGTPTTRALWLAYVLVCLPKLEVANCDFKTVAQDCKIIISVITF